MQRILSASLLCAAAAIVFFTFFGPHGVKHLQKLSAEAEVLERNNRDFRATIAGLKNQIFAVKKDPHSLEKTSRTEVGMAKEGEVIYVFSKPKDVQ
jgi:cell division protein FtsB